jgi:simple sugar transport system permease protein
MNFVRQLINRKSSNPLTQVVIFLVSFLLALITGGVLLAIQGHKDVLSVYYYLLIHPLTTWGGIEKVLVQTTPLIFAGLAVAIAFKCDVFNIGVEGQLYAGGLAAAYLGYTLQGLPPLVHVCICVLGAMLVGGLFALLAGWLKVRFGVHEVLSTIMMNHVINNIVTLLIVDFFRYEGPTARTPTVQDSARLLSLSDKSQLNSGLIIAVLLCVVLYIVFEKTPFGWRLNAAGKNLRATTYCGVDAKRLILIAMLVSGALAGLLGAERILGGFGYLQVNFSPGYGYDGITIAVIAANNPFGCLLMSLLMGLLNAGGTQLNVMTDVPSEWVDMLSAFVFVFVVAANAVILKLPELKEKRLARERRLTK